MPEQNERQSSSPSHTNPALPNPPLADLFDVLPDGILLLDEQWRIAYANQTARKISRIRPEDLNSKTHWELYPETIGTEVEETYREVMATRREGCIKAFFYEPFHVWLEIRVLPVPDGIALYYHDITATHAAKSALRESEDRLRLALAAANGIGTWSWDVPNDRVYADAAFANLYGVDPVHAAGGAPIAEFTRNILPEDLVTVGPAIDAAIRDGSEFASQYRIRQAGGSARWVAARGRCTHDASGAPLRFNGVIVDISDQKLREDELRRSEQRYRILTELSPQCLWTANPEGIVLYANQRFLDYIGRESIPSTSDEYLSCFDEADRDRILRVWSHSVATGQEYAIDARLIRASDRFSRWCHLRAAPIRDDSGKIQQWLGTAVDVHEERLAAMRLREQYAELDRQRRELETIYNGSPIGMALYEPADLRVLRINHYQSGIFGIHPEDAIGKTLQELTPSMTGVHNLVRRAASGEILLNQTVEGELPSDPGKHRFFNANFSPIFAEDGSVRAIAAATVETTLQRRAELALIQSEKLAAVGRMASSIAHEINNPLESVTNLIYIARQHSTTAEIQNLLDLADQELRRVSIITNQTLRFHKQASYPREITCLELFSTVLSLYEGRLRNSSIAVEKRKRASCPIACFEGDIRQVLNNLVGNSIDAMPNGGRLLLRSRDATDWRNGRRGLVLTVADTGAGISPEARAHVFEAFYTTKGINGTGLGLWIGNEIVARHDGRLLLRTSQNPSHRGTVFSLFLPFPPEPSTNPPPVTTDRIQ